MCADRRACLCAYVLSVDMGEVESKVDIDNPRSWERVVQPRQRAFLR